MVNLAKHLKIVERRVMRKIKKRMEEIAKDPVLRAQMEKDIKHELKGR